MASHPPAQRSAESLRVTMLRKHNLARTNVHTPPLAWDTRLAGSARAYAQVMARTGHFAHAPQPHGAARTGENLWTGTHNAYRYNEMVNHWLEEKRDFVNRPAPSFSRTRHWQDVAHYTQIVWRDTRRVGCAMASNSHDDFLVCRYSPAGNVVGRHAF